MPAGQIFGGMVSECADCFDKQHTAAAGHLFKLKAHLICTPGIFQHRGRYIIGDFHKLKGAVSHIKRHTSACSQFPGTKLRKPLGQQLVIGQICPDLLCGLLVMPLNAYCSAGMPLLQFGDHIHTSSLSEIAPSYRIAV
ncbi:hypothetical protein D3C80_1416380 [compost metagenome]